MSQRRSSRAVQQPMIQPVTQEEEPPKRRMPLPPSLRLLIRHRTILVARQVDRQLMERVTGALFVLDARDGERPITVVINSPGGDADSGFAIYDALRFVKSPVRTICAGLAASAAVPIFLGGRKGQRFALPNARFLLHQPSMQMMGVASDIEITANEIERVRERYNRIVESETGRALQKIREDTNRDFWLSATEAVDYGLVDRVVTHRAEID